MAVRIGTNPIAWSNDDMPELGGDTPLETCLSEARQAGFSGIELGNKFPRQAAQLRPILERHNLSLISGWYSARLLERSAEEEIKAMSDHLNLLRDLEATVMVFAETARSIASEKQTPLSQRPRIQERDWPGFCRRLTMVANYLTENGVTMAYHHHMGTAIETAADIDRLMEETGPNVGLLFDTGHLTYAGADPMTILKNYGRRINHVHCKDVRKETLLKMRREDSSFLNAVLNGVFTVPGDGSIDFAPILAKLKSLKYKGWLVVEAEQDPAKAPPLAYATKGYAYLSATAQTAGLTLKEIAG
ncbi:MAG: myo-inosose-2 dehydratase [Alphaproteobacteria bacterium]